MTDIATPVKVQDLKPGMLIDLEPVFKEYVSESNIDISEYEYARVLEESDETMEYVSIYTDQGDWNLPLDYRVTVTGYDFD